jgi:cell volume regulation protein A
VGILAGSEGIGGIYFDNPIISQFIGVLALNFILFSGGLDTNWQRIRPILWRGMALSTIGVFITALAVGLFVHYVLDFTLLEGLLLGSIVSSTDAAAVFSILRSKGVGLKGSLRPVLELESGSNDPMAYFLTITFTALVADQQLGIWELLPMLAQQFILGGTIGFGMGKLSLWIINRIKLDFEGLYPVLILGLALFTYSITDFLGGNGFLAIYISGVVIGNHAFIHKRSIIRFYEGQAWLMQIVLFLTLGLLVFPSHVFAVAGYGILIAAFLILVARPLGVFISLIFFKTTIRSKLFISWVGLRGAVPIVFATYPMIAGLSKSDMIFNLVFFISVTSVLLQGTTLSQVAKWLHVSLPPNIRRRNSLGEASFESVKEVMKEIDIPKNALIAGKRIVDLSIPEVVHIMAIKRENHFTQPIGSTIILEGDTLFLLADNDEVVREVADRLQLRKS